jgi:hypothetical protein
MIFMERRDAGLDRGCMHHGEAGEERADASFAVGFVKINGICLWDRKGGGDLV